MIGMPQPLNNGHSQLLKLLTCLSLGTMELTVGSISTHTITEQA